MYKRITLRLVTLAAAALLATPAVTLANEGGQPHSTSACPTHSHSGNHNGGSKGKHNGSGKGKKCG